MIGSWLSWCEFNSGKLALSSFLFNKNLRIFLIILLSNMIIVTMLAIRNAILIINLLSIKKPTSEK